MTDTSQAQPRALPGLPDDEYRLTDAGRAAADDPGWAATDLSNVQLAGRDGTGKVSIAFPRARMTCREALVHAAWLVLLADDNGEFDGILAAVRGES